MTLRSLTLAASTLALIAAAHAPAHAQGSDDVADTGLPILLGDAVDLVPGGADTGQMRRGR